MKILLIVLLSLFIQTQDVKLEGKYKIEYETKFQSQNGNITFKKDSYTRKLNAGGTVKGKVLYEKRFIKLTDENGKFEMVIINSDAKKDTIAFGTTDLTKPMDGGKIIIHSGKLIPKK